MSELVYRSEVRIERVRSSGRIGRGTFGGALMARQIDASGGRSVGKALGEIELEGNVLVIRQVGVIGF